MLLLALLALVRAHSVSAVPPAAWEVGEPVPLRLAELRGASFRLLPGVGPALAERLEAARLAAGGALNEASLDAVRGVGPALLRQWEPLWAR
ncbi:MAG: hypothetical protein ACT4PU_08145 [Planctomycetota bacterium]